ncbi:phosphatidylglycerophosphatase A [Saprospiraceae bacterium]|jgi:phosphatidylglycerophosphatase A|nr:phosphatidylglycerophosphatase A [Bacteroidota bacterium]MDB4728365.1 phosphatidylglycerophosphatase A [Saprospiraceae bacterium]MDF1866265.1 phosphatidylglycerophosphatase A [Saprospiraceae bacterium]
MKLFWKIMATGFGVGYSPFAPGTMGALVGVLFLVPNLFISTWFNGSYLIDPVLVLLILVFFFIGVKATNELEPEWGHDPQKIVIDEIIGFWIAMIAVPYTAWTLFVGFVLFRIFDIWKPLGIRRMEKFNGGWGVMMDDVLAGIYANIVLQILVFSFPNLFL